MDPSAHPSTAECQIVSVSAEPAKLMRLSFTKATLHCWVGWRHTSDIFTFTDDHHMLHSQFFLR